MASKTILVVDDDAGILRLVAIMLQREGFTVITAENGDQALAQFATEKPDLILLDLAMPGLNGMDVAREIRQREAGGSHTPIIILTALAENYFASRDFDIDVQGYLTKPVTLQRLRQEIDQLPTP
ncbi:MAG: response regulator [Anaerolineae bacterium]|nr:response regulator [Anaerolineae bacterium]